MPNPAVLPQELFDSILDYAINSSLDIKSSCTLCLVDRCWYKTATLLLYSKWTYHGEDHSSLSLWRFLRTVISNASIAALVQTLHIRNWHCFSLRHSETDRHISLSQEELRVIRAAIHE